MTRLMITIEFSETKEPRLLSAIIELIGKIVFTFLDENASVSWRQEQ